jgi:hypothetical protein
MLQCAQAGDRQLEVVLGRHRDIIGWSGTAHHYGPNDASMAELDSLRDCRDPESPGIEGLQNLHDTRYTESVRVRLNHGEDAHLRPHRLNDAVVVGA